MSKHGASAGRRDLQLFDPNDVIIIGIDTPDDPTHKLYDRESNATPLKEATIAYTYQHGIIEPISARRDGDKVIVAMGRGRTRYLRKANALRVADGLQPWLLPTQIVKGDDAKMLALKHGENSHRRDIGPAARAAEAHELCQQMPKEQAATILGLSLSQLKNVIAYLDLAPEVTDAVTAGKLSATAATTLHKLPREEQVAQLGKLLESGDKPTVAKATNRAREAAGKEAKMTPKNRLAVIAAVIAGLDDDTTKDGLWLAIRKIKKAMS